MFDHPCPEGSTAGGCVRMDGPSAIIVPLIPALDHPEDCAKISDRNLAGQCRQLNTFRAAFLHVATIPEVRTGKALCRQVDKGPLSAQCLKTLQFYVQNPSRFENRPAARPNFEPVDRVLILNPIAGLEPRRPGLLSQDLYYERAVYSVSYGSPQEPIIDAVHLNVITTLDRNQEIQDALRQSGDDYKPGMERREVIDGSPVTVLDLSKTNRVLWSSRDLVVNVTFYTPALYANLGESRARAALATPDARRELLRQYLLKYPPDR